MRDVLTECAVERLAPAVMKVRAVEVVRAMLQEILGAEVYFLSEPAVRMDYPRKPKLQIPTRPSAFAVREIGVSGSFTALCLPRPLCNGRSKAQPEVSALLNVTNDPDGEVDWKLWTVRISILGVPAREDLHRFVLFDEHDSITPQPPGYIREFASAALRMLEAELRHRGSTWL